MHTLCQALTCTAIFSLLVTGCHPSEGPAIDGDDLSVQPAQADPDVDHSDFTLYTLRLTFDNDYLESQVLSVGNASTTLGYAAGKEYWYLTEEFLEISHEAEALDFDAASDDWGETPVAPAAWDGSSSSPEMDAQVSWTSLVGAPTGALFASGNDMYYAIRFSGTPAAPVVEWFIGAEDEPAYGTYVVTPAGLSFTSTAPVLSEGMVWYAVDD